MTSVEKTIMTRKKIGVGKITLLKLLIGKVIRRRSVSMAMHKHV